MKFKTLYTNNVGDTFELRFIDLLDEIKEIKWFDLNNFTHEYDDKKIYNWFVEDNHVVVNFSERNEL